MKIIGYCESGYIVELPRHEAEAITGVPESHYSLPHKHYIGRVINIHDSWQKLAPIIRNAKEIRDRATNLRGLADVLDGTAALVDRATELAPATPTVETT